MDLPDHLLKRDACAMQSGLKPKQMRQQLGRFGLSGHHHLQWTSLITC